MRVRDDEPAARAKDARELGYRRLDVRQVAEGERTYRSGDRVVGERQGRQLAEAEVDARQLGARSGEDRLACVNADDLAAHGDQVGSMMSRATGGVEDGTRWEVVEQRSDDWLLEGDRVVAGLVVALCPARVALRDPVPGQVAPLGVGRLVEAGGDLLDLSNPMLRFTVTTLSAGAEHGESFDAEHVVALAEIRGHAGHASRTGFARLEGGEDEKTRT